MTVLVSGVSGGSRGGSPEPPFATKFCHFHRALLEKIMKKDLKLTNRTPLCEFEPPF